MNFKTKKNNRLTIFKNNSTYNMKRPSVVDQFSFQLL